MSQSSESVTTDPLWASGGPASQPAVTAGRELCPLSARDRQDVTVDNGQQTAPRTSSPQDRGCHQQRWPQIPGALESRSEGATVSLISCEGHGFRQSLESQTQNDFSAGNLFEDFSITPRLPSSVVAAKKLGVGWRLESL
ncbi:hypothetical protein BaRGS_00013679 [Batillaria attramentaria]|uniref:Uncharacterized protein n=1 Tax=Batillaria attramentaria TaxID=370345 RepID=A0ABD0L7K2_9CAEN